MFGADTSAQAAYFNRALLLLWPTPSVESQWAGFQRRKNILFQTNAGI
jgi:hypothetical protein